MNQLKPKSKGYATEAAALRAITNVSQNSAYAVSCPMELNELMVAIVVSDGRFYPVVLPHASEVQFSISLVRVCGFMTLWR